MLGDHVETSEKPHDGISVVRLSRREFIRSSAATGVGAFAAFPQWASAEAGKLGENPAATIQAWTVQQTGPVIPLGRVHPLFDATRAGAAHVVRFGDRYTMVYWGSDKQGRNYILRAESPVDNPNQWVAVGGLLIGPQPNTNHNCRGPSFPFLLPVTDQHWLLYFCGWGRRADRKLANTTGVAISEDGGQTWRYHDDNPVLPLDRPYDAEGTGSVWVLHEQDKFRMYYTAIGRYFSAPKGVKTGHGSVIPEIGIAYAESHDGMRWEKPLDDWVVRPRAFGVKPYEYICSKPCLLRDGATYTMWVNTFGTAYRVHRLVSRDGTKWQWAERTGADGELGVGGKGSFDDHQRSYPTVIRHDNEYRCWYTGNGFGCTGMGYAVCQADASGHAFRKEP